MNRFLTVKIDYSILNYFTSFLVTTNNIEKKKKVYLLMIIYLQSMFCLRDRFQVLRRLGEPVIRD